MNEDLAGDQDEAGPLLLRMARQRDPVALGQLYDRYSSRAYRVALAVVGDRASSEECVQEAFFKVWLKAPSFDPARGSGERWVMSIVQHQAIDSVRRRGMTGRDVPLTEWQLPKAAPDPWDAVRQRLDHDRVAAALAELPAPQRRTVQLAYLAGWSHSQIAQIECVPLGTVKGRLRLAVEKLRISLMPEPE